MALPSSLIVSGSGVADISGNAPTFVVSGVAGALGTLQFTGSSTADDATIRTNAFGQTIFSGNSNPGLARFITNADGVVDFSGTSGSAGNNRITAASIEGAGTYNLGSNLLQVGLNGLSTTVSGTINDGGANGGSGASLVKVGDGTLILSGNNTYTGLTAVLGGTLQLGDGGASGSIIGNVFNHTTVAVNRSDTYTYAGRIIGDGAFEQMGSGTTILTGNSLYLGGTTISAGTLQLGNGGTSGSIFGNVVNNGTFAINRSDTYSFGGAISGGGAVVQMGPGTTILTGTNSYSGGTAINAGVLAVVGRRQSRRRHGRPHVQRRYAAVSLGLHHQPRGHAQRRRRHHRHQRKQCRARRRHRRRRRPQQDRRRRAHPHGCQRLLACTRF